MLVTAAALFMDALDAAKANAFATVDQLIADAADESEWREFKGAQQLSRFPLDAVSAKKIKSIWSESLSAFGNSGGGLLIWGIQAPDRVAKNHSLAHDAARLAELLIKYQNDAVDPPVPGVRVVTAQRPGSLEGFVVCHIPASEYSPHRAKWAEREYYLRTADSSQSMPTEILRRMFYPRIFPRLLPKLALTVSLGDDRLLHVGILVKLANVGSASAEEAFVEVDAWAPDNALVAYPSREWKNRIFSKGLVCDVTIHPNETMPFLTNLAPRVGFEEAKLPSLIHCAFRIYCRHAPALFAEARFSGEEIRRCAERKSKLDRDAEFRERLTLSND